MRVTRSGNNFLPGVAVVGNFDPFGPNHKRLIQDVSRHAHERNLNAVAVILHPAPSTFINPQGTWIVYDDHATRVKLLHEAGADAVVTVHFCKRDLKAGIRDLLDAIGSTHALQELWIGSMQSLGTGDLGNQTTILQATTERGIHLQKMETPKAAVFGNPKFELSEGRVRTATSILGRPPIWKKPKNNELILSWLPGRYQAIALQDPIAFVDGEILEFELEALPLIDTQPGAKALSKLTWIDPKVQWLAFVSGPNDARHDEVARVPNLALSFAGSFAERQNHHHAKPA
jgi:FAD synthetase